MAKYKIIKEISFGSGYIKNGQDTISMQSLAPKINDIIELGEIKEKTLWSSAPMKGFDFIVNLPNNETYTGWIPYQSVEKMPDNTEITNYTNQKQGNQKTTSFFTPKNIIIGVVGIGIIFGILKLTKVI